MPLTMKVTLTVPSCLRVAVVRELRSLRRWHPSPVASLPRMSDRRIVCITLHLQLEGAARARPKFDRQKRRINVRRYWSALHAHHLMFAIGPALHDDCAALGWIQVDQRYGRVTVAERRDERGHILRQPGALAIEIEVAKPRVHQTAFPPGQQSAPPQ